MYIFTHLFAYFQQVAALLSRDYSAVSEATFEANLVS